MSPGPIDFALAFIGAGNVGFPDWLAELMTEHYDFAASDGRSPSIPDL